jgi:hypothetical protein
VPTVLAITARRKHARCSESDIRLGYTSIASMVRTSLPQNIGFYE